LVRELERAGFANRGGKGRHRNYRHPRGVRITISDGLDDDAKPHQERDTAQALREVRS
jgi:predicted RNA binding protein YcfA (HicA-like mRNA interferase family)